MTRTALSLTLLASALACALAVPAQAQPVRAFVALTGADANPCTFASPCKSVQHAHDVVMAGGEIRMLDPGSYGLLTITKSVTILGEGHGGIAAAGAFDAITINAGVNDTVNLRGLVIEGFGSGTYGIKFNAGGTLNIHDSVIKGFGAIGIFFQPATAGRLNVSNTVVADTTGGGTAILIQPIGSGSVAASFDHVTLENGVNGLKAAGSVTSGTIDVAITDSVVRNFSGNGVYALSTSGATRFMVRNCTITGTGMAVAGDGQAAVVRVTRSTMTANGLAWSWAGNLISYGDNNTDGNTTATLPSSTVGYH